MICEEARLHIGAEPGAPPLLLREHLEGCSACSQYRAEMLALDGALRAALEQGPVLPQRTGAAAKAPPQQRGRVWALAASAVLGLLGVGVLWTALPRDTLAREVSIHLTYEPDAWSAPQAPSPQEINAVLRPAHVALASGQDRVTFARKCYVHGIWAPHLVVRTQQGPVAVLILPGVQTRSSRLFHDHGFTGMILPAPRGSVAVLTQKKDLGAEVVRELSGAVRWLPDQLAAQ